jgi:protein-S-isoprenylcysteine O-methyltransferase Ste14
MLESSTVRYLVLVMVAAYSAAFFLDLFLGTGRARRRLGTVRTEGPTAGIMGSVWPLLQMSMPVAFLIEVLVPAWVYEGGITLAYPGAEFVQIAGIVLWVAALGLLLWSIRNLGRFQWGAGAIYEDQTIVATGPYRRIRHPIYAAEVYLSLGGALLLLHPVLLLLPIATFAVSWRLAGTEEAMFLSDEEYGQAYRALVAQTGRFFPRLRA